MVAKHFAIDQDKVQVKIERGKSVSLLEIDIEIPNPSRESRTALRPAARIRPSGRSKQTRLGAEVKIRQAAGESQSMQIYLMT